MALRQLWEKQLNNCCSHTYLPSHWQESSHLISPPPACLQSLRTCISIVRAVTWLLCQYNKLSLFTLCPGEIYPDPCMGERDSHTLGHSSQTLHVFAEHTNTHTTPHALEAIGGDRVWPLLEGCSKNLVVQAKAQHKVINGGQSHKESCDKLSQVWSSCIQSVPCLQLGDRGKWPSPPMMFIHKKWIHYWAGLGHNENQLTIYY